MLRYGAMIEKARRLVYRYSSSTFSDFAGVFEDLYEDFMASIKRAQEILGKDVAKEARAFLLEAYSYADDPKVGGDLPGITDIYVYLFYVKFMGDRLSGPLSDVDGIGGVLEDLSRSARTKMSTVKGLFDDVVGVFAGDISRYVDDERDLDMIVDDVVRFFKSETYENSLSREIRRDVGGFPSRSHSERTSDYRGLAQRIVKKHFDRDVASKVEGVLEEWFGVLF